MDWNNDGKKDLISGDSTGKVWLFLNTGTDKAPVLVEGIQLKAAGKSIVGTNQRYEKDKNGQYVFVRNTNEIMGVYSKIHAGDWDGDGLRDLLVGQDGPGGDDLILYRNVGTAGAPNLDKPVPIALPAPGMPRVSPYLVDWDGDGIQDLLFGTEGCKVYFFWNTGTKQKPVFAEGRLVDLKAKGFEKGYRSRIEVVDWNNDGKLDILVGNANNDGKGGGGNIWLFIAK